MVQVVTNLVSNAIKFTDDGSVKINISSIGKDDKNNPTLKVEIIDTGVGIDKKSKELLFKSFSQLDITSKKSYKGTGLGLAISQKLVELMEGDISVSSKEGIGSNFYFTLSSREDIHEPVLENENLDNDDSPVNLVDKLIEKGFTALLVDDKIVNLKVAELLVKKSGGKVYTAMNGFEALDVFKEKQDEIDVIFMDIQMPRIDDIETTKRLISLYPGLPPFVALTANAMKGDREKYLAAGMND